MGHTKTLREAARVLAGLDDAEVLDGLERALGRLSREAGRRAEKLARLRGQNASMIRFGLDRTLVAHRKPHLLSWLEEARREAGGGRLGPEVVIQILAGNVAGLAVPAAIEALLARSSVILKPASNEAVIPRCFERCLKQEAPQLGDAVEVREWAGGDRPVEDPLLAEADFVVASGGADMVSSLGPRLPDAHTLHGPRHSIGLVNEGWEALPESWWEDLGREIVLWDQEGCLSPRVLLVSGAPHRFAERLAGMMKIWEETWPAPGRSAAEAAAVLEFRAHYEMTEDPDAGVFAPSGSAWTVVWDRASNLDCGPPLRVVRVTSIPETEALDNLLGEAADDVQCVGVVRDLEPDWKELAQRLVGCGIPWVAELTAIQDPPAGWRADGRSGLAELLKQGRD